MYLHLLKRWPAGFDFGLSTNKMLKSCLKEKNIFALISNEKLAQKLKSFQKLSCLSVMETSAYVKLHD